MPKLFENETMNGGRLHFTESVDVKPMIKENEKLADIKMNIAESLKEKRLILKPKIAAIHEGRTRNHTIYLEDKLRGSMVHEKGPTGMYSFLYPYNKPMLKNHDTDSEPTGRIKGAQFVKTTEGNGYIMIVPHITDQDTVEKLLDGRYLTVSIGASTDSIICNICGKDLMTEGWCEHDRGQTYDGTVCGWILGNLWFDECSWVNVPADVKAMVLNIEDSEIYAEVNQETYDISTGLNIAESTATELGLIAVTESVSDQSITLPEEVKETEGEDKDIPATITEENTEVNTEENTEAIVESIPEVVTEENLDENPEDVSGEDSTIKEEADPTEIPDTNLVQELPEDKTKNEENAFEFENFILEVTRRLETVEFETKTINESLELQKTEYINLSNEFARFIKEAINDKMPLVEEEKINLENLDIKELTEEYKRVVSLSTANIINLAEYKVENLYGNEQLALKDKKEVTPVDVYKYILAGKNKKR